MKTLREDSRSGHGPRRGSAVILVMMVLAILSVLVASNTRTVVTLSDELKLVEKRQVAHWTGTRTNKTAHLPLAPAQAGQP